jgi:primase-polymerase (primpol)-like protein
MENKYKYIPEEMKVLKRFMGWRKEKRNEKIAKIPFSLIDRQGMGWNNPDRWLDFEKAKDKNQALGFVLTEEDNIICVDLDQSIVDSHLIAMAKEIVEAFKGTYMELSQSGEGIHIFCKGKLLDNIIRPSEGIEIYKNNRYIALTGDVGKGDYFPISNQLLDKQEELDVLYKKWVQEGKSIKSHKKDFKRLISNQYSHLKDLSLSEILETMERTNSKAKSLIKGESITGDHSRDDFIFLLLARNYTDGNPELMKDLFLMTPLNRIGSQEKRKDDRKYLEYVDKTLESVLELGSYIPFDWSRHLAYKQRMEAYERT